ncbi:ABC transporter substrate-binding protein [Microbacterium sp. UBA3394]|uniref:ABC transporter substrate-binding protein n=1 Tax=Microbacterium sp. UBA3394 TaxID=1946945 RepID=UPI00257C16EC|nr:ABC transporter substrate-binding protein [Microbacterium sp. UBA3394]
MHRKIPQRGGSQMYCTSSIPQRAGRDSGQVARVRRRVLGATVAFGAAIGLVACGATAPGTTSAGDGPQETVQLTLGTLNAAPQLTPLFAAVSEGYFAEEGLQVELLAISGGTSALSAALANDSVDIAILSAPDTALFNAQGAIDARAFGQLSNGTYDFVVTDDVDSADDLRGGSVGVSSIPGIDYLMLRTFLDDFGVDESEVTVLSLGGSANRVAGIAAGQVSAIASPIGQRSTIEQVGGLKVLEVDNQPWVPTALYVAEQEWFEGDDVEVLERFIDAMNATTTWLRENPDEAVRICVEENGFDQESCENDVAGLLGETGGPYTWSQTQEIDMEGMQVSIDIQAPVVPEVGDLTLEDIATDEVTGR